MLSEKIGVPRVALSRVSGHVGSCGPSPVYAAQPVRRSESSVESTVLSSQNNFSSYGIMTRLHNAALRGDIRVVRKLVNLGENVNARNGDHMTPLMLAAHRGHATVIRHLLNKGANSRARQSEHNPKTALIYAVERGNVNSVRALLIHSNLNVQGGNGRSALTTAANLRKPNIVQMLIRAGARPNAMTLGYIMNNSALRNSIGGMFVRRALAKKAVRAVMTARMKNRNFSMREQLSGVNVETGSTRVKGLPSGVRNLIGTMMRGRRQ